MLNFHHHNENQSKHERVYDRVLNRLRNVLGKMEQVTVNTLKEEIDKAIQLEADIETLTADEVSLLTAYVNRDIAHLKQYLLETERGLADWLKFDALLVETKLLDVLASIADQTVIGWQDLQQRLQHDQDTYLRGEVTCAGTLVCLNCDAVLRLKQTTTIPACPNCDGEHFCRATETEENSGEL
jgi:predicted RNA-binding Zn-ribbon protein involved in translation (DUF1610 family)